MHPGRDAVIDLLAIEADGDGEEIGVLFHGVTEALLIEEVQFAVRDVEDHASADLRIPG